MNIEERVKISILTKYYGALLTEKQRDIVTMYVDNNLTLVEISEELGVSRQAVKDALDNAMDSLNNFELKLEFVARDERIKALLEDKALNEIDMATRLQIIQILED